MKVLTKNGLTLREAVPNDRTAIIEFVRSSLKEFNTQYCGCGSENDLEDLFGHYLGPRASFLVVSDSDQIAGTIGLLPIEDGHAKLRKMYVSPAYRQHGLGSLLVETIIERARSFGYHTIILETMSVMQSAIRLYKRFGFQEVNKQPVSARCDIVMKKVL